MHRSVAARGVENPVSLGMNNNVGEGRRLVQRVVFLQAACAASIGVVSWMVAGAAAGWSGFAGGSIVAVGSAVFGWRFFADGIAPARAIRRALFAAESLKWLWYVVAMWVALARIGARPLPLMAGLVLAQFGYWIGLVGMKRR